MKKIIAFGFTLLALVSLKLKKTMGGCTASLLPSNSRNFTNARTT